MLRLGALVNCRAANGSTPLHWAAQCGNIGVVNALISAGADVGATTNSWTTDAVFGAHSGQTPLHWAAASGHGHIVALLLLSGSHMSAQDERGNNAQDLVRGELAEETFLVWF